MADDNKPLTEDNTTPMESTDNKAPVQNYTPDDKADAKEQNDKIQDANEKAGGPDREMIGSTPDKK